jgi:signal transduction protein with GAF and PtsI domain
MQRRDASGQPVKGWQTTGPKAREAPTAAGTSATDLQEQVAALTRELKEAREQQTATSDVLKVISRSTFDLQTVFDTLVKSAAKLCEARFAMIFRRDGDVYRLAANHGFTPEYRDWMERQTIALGRGTLVGRTAVEGRTFQISDALADPEYVWSESISRGGFRTLLGVPLLREGQHIGVITLCRSEVAPFTDKQVELVKTFADQAVIAIENARLFDEVQARTRELSESLEQQTATSEVLKVIASSSGELQQVFDTMLANATRLCGASYGAISEMPLSTVRCPTSMSSKLAGFSCILAPTER